MVIGESAVADIATRKCCGMTILSNTSDSPAEQESSKSSDACSGNENNFLSIHRLFYSSPMKEFLFVPNLVAPQSRQSRYLSSQWRRAI